jgi:glutathione synthase/RimK-type ligase-like ATP-grasp enzyme
MNPDEAAWAAAEAKHALGGLLAALPARQWLNHPVRAAAAEAKPVQLSEAARRGLRVPSTLITNDPRAAGEFAAAYGHVCYKPLTATTIPGPDGEQVIYAVRLAASDLSGNNAAAIRGTAHQFQQWIDAAFAVRMVVVDGAVYPAAIRAHSDAARVDWRSDYAHLTYETVTVPAAVRDNAVSLVRGLGLRFSSMDLLVDRQDRWWFVDLNPSGQWCWIPDLNDQVAAALAEALTKGPQWQ